MLYLCLLIAATTSTTQNIFSQIFKDRCKDIRGNDPCYLYVLV